MNISGSNYQGNWVKCFNKHCEEYVQPQLSYEMPLCSTHKTFDTTPSITTDEMFEKNDTTQREFFERCKQLEKRVSEEILRTHGKMVRWNKKFEMCSNCNDVSTCTFFKYFIILSF